MPNDAAGPFYFIWCPKCGAFVKIFDRSFWGNDGKKCPNCKILISPAYWDEKKQELITINHKTITEFTNRKMCPVCKRKMMLLDAANGIRGCMYERNHKK